jgi:hypothetical protein
MTQPVNPPDPHEVEDLKVASDLRNASDAFMRQLDRLVELEERKRELPPGDPEFTRLAREVEDLAAAALAASGTQVRLADAVADIAKRGDRDIADHPIVEMPPGPREAALILAEWRAAERALAAASPGSDDERVAREQAERLRREYAAHVNLRQGRDVD